MGPEGFGVPAQLVEHRATLVEQVHAEAEIDRRPGRLDFELELVEHGQGFVIGLPPAAQHGPLQGKMRVARRDLLGLSQQFAGALILAVGLLHPGPAIEGVEDIGGERGRLAIQFARLLDAPLRLQVPGQVRE